MMTISMCGEVFTFGHDQDLLGYCLDDPNEPARDDFHTRCRDRIDGPWVDPHVGFATNEDLFVDGEGENEFDREEYIEAEDDKPVVSTPFVEYCKMSPPQQAKVIENLQIYIATNIGAAYDWKPPVDLLLDCIQDGVSIEVMLARGKALYEYEPSDGEEQTSYDYNDYDEWVPAQAGGHSKSQHAERAVENVYRAQLAEIERDAGDHWRTSAKVSNERRKQRGLTKESVRTDASHYFGFAGKGDGFEEYVEHLIAFEDEPNIQEDTHWLMEDAFLQEALFESESHVEYLYSEYAIEMVDFHRRSAYVQRRHFGGIDDWCDSDDWYDDYDRRDTFDDYDPPAEAAPSESEQLAIRFRTTDDDEPDWSDYLPDWYWDMIPVSARSTPLVRCGTPRHHVRRMSLVE